MISEVEVANGMFALAILSMISFALVWCMRAFARLREIRKARPELSRTFRRESNARGLKLLKDWLSSTQLQSYEKHKYFDVIGSDSARLYRIYHGLQANIEQLDGDGLPVCAWCLLPEGDLVTGDVMLSQKIAFETDEYKALARAIQYPIELTRRNRHRRWRSPRVPSVRSLSV